MREAKIYRYILPMDSGVILRDNKLTERVGYVVVLSEGDQTSPKKALMTFIMVKALPTPM